MPELGSLGSAVGKLGSALKAQDSLADGGQASSEDLAHVLTNMAERGKGVLVEQIMFALSSGERIDLLRQMDRINEAHRQTNHKLPDLVISYDKKGYSVAVDYPGSKDDMVIWSAKIDKDDHLTNVICNTAKELPTAPSPVPQSQQRRGGDTKPGDIENYPIKTQGQNQEQRTGGKQVVRRDRT